MSGQRWSPSTVRGAASGIMLSGFFNFVFVYNYQGKFWKRKFTWGKNDHQLKRFLGSMMNIQSAKSTLIRIDPLLFFFFPVILIS